MKYNNEQFEKKSSFNKERESYLDSSNNYVYKHDGKFDIIPFDESLREIFKYLVESDHAMDKQERNEKDHRKIVSEDNADTNHPIPEIEKIPNSHSIEEYAFTNDLDTRSKIVRDCEEFVHSLPEKQQDLIYAHYGQKLTFEQIACMEGDGEKPVSRQAICNRLTKIKKIVFEEFKARYSE